MRSAADSSRRRAMSRLCLLTLLTWAATCTFPTVGAAADKDDFVPLFPDEGVPRGWVVRQWNDLAAPAKGSTWVVKDGVLHSGKSRGTWLVSEKEYDDFILEVEIKLTAVGNSGIALRAPMKGDPAFDGMELQVADYRYNTQAKPSELTGGIYRAIARASKSTDRRNGTSSTSNSKARTSKQRSMGS